MSVMRTETISVEYAGAATESVPVVGLQWGRFSVAEESGELSSAVLEAQYSLDNVSWHAPGAEVTAAGISTELDLQGVAYLRVRVKTAEGAEAQARITLYAEGA